MSKVDVKVSLETEIERYWVTVDDMVVLRPPVKKQTISLEVDTEHYIGWWFAGNPGSSYKIELSPADGYKVVAVGKHPIERKIAQNRFHSSDTLRFFVVKKKEDKDA